jgi:hypothetical protein
MNHYLGKVQWILVIWLACLLQTVMAENKTFGVDSYIPQKFIDFEWKLNGGFNLSGQNRSGDRDYFSGPYRLRHSNSSADKQSLSVNTNLFYRNETPQRFYIVYGNVLLRANNGNSSSSTYYTDNRGSTNNSYNEGGNNSYYSSMKSSFESGKYLISDFFALGTASLTATYDIDPESRSTIYEQSFRRDTIPAISETYRESAEESKHRSNSRYYRVDISAGSGWGRIYSGQYAATALYVIDEMKKNGLLKQTPTGDEMTHLADIIYRYRNTRSIDSRIHKIEALSEIIDYLNSIDAIDYSDKYGYLLIQDVWDYFPRNSRDFGFQVKALAGINYTFQSQDGSDYGYESLFYTRNIPDSGIYDTLADSRESFDRHHRDNYEVREPYLSVSCKYAKPVNLRWQFTNLVDMKYYFRNTEVRQWFDSYIDEGRQTYSESNQIRFADYSILISADVDYILDSRTSVTGAFDYSYRHYHLESKNIFIDDGELIRDETEVSGRETQSIRLTGMMRYRISIPTTLNASISYNVYDNDNIRGSSDEDHTSNYSLGLSLSHYLY